ncbi:DUF4229 domain-containing protein [Pseudonocardia acidicola]|uniref:DUF4229 domain-containing protein n=1 Tax=Pseudonocardia acidicola TaxID=2724939 RepID=A0ABX1SDU1_9PSEU|nr:DUF4229 domain-containing protein [Pseudonocardia acidicola]NMH99710.1 DUF4229 domain-containing protein [Pseudonocardia acidicola]
MTDSALTPPGPTGAGPGRQPGLGMTLALYTLARLGLLAVLTAVLALAGIPFLLALLLALIVALPLSLVLFRGLRRRLDGALAVARERRAAEREALRARLRGEEQPGDRSPADPPRVDVAAAYWARPAAEPSSGEAAQRESDTGRD